MITRTRKWKHLAQEAVRLADLQMTPTQIARHIGVVRQTVIRWMAKGQVPDTRRGKGKRSPVEPGMRPGVWGAAVRSSYALDASDEELVRAGEAALLLAHDRTEKATVRLNAMRTFGGIVKQLALVARLAEAEPEEDVKPAEPVRVISRPSVDPRTALRAVK